MAEGDVLKDELAPVLRSEAEQIDDQGEVGHAEMINTND